MKSKKIQGKIFVLVLLCTVQCYLLAACSKSEPTVKDSATTSEVVTSDSQTPANIDATVESEAPIESVEVTKVVEVKPAKTESELESANTKNKDNPDAISIKYVSNSCFLITFADGTKLVTDPDVGSWTTKNGPFPETEVDVMTISHNHSDHIIGKRSFTGDPQVLKLEDVNKTVTVGDVKITGYMTEHVADMGDNAIFVYEENGLKVVHMGETDNIESQEAKDAVKDADVILAYAGEYGVVENKDSFETLFNNLNIKVLIPQHYSQDANNLIYGQPAMETILTQLPESTSIAKTDEFFVVKDLDKQFVALSLMKIE